MFPSVVSYYDGTNEKHPEEYYIHPKQPNIGIAFSGGGCRSMACTTGILRSLHHLKLLPYVKYVSCVSGSSWAVIPYCYRGDNDYITDEMLLGKVKDPKTLTMATLNSISPYSLLYPAIDNGIFSMTVKNVLKKQGRYSYANAVRDVILKPFKLHQPKLFTWTKEYLQNELLLKNPNLKEDDFYCMRKNRPFPIISSTFIDSSHPEETQKKKCIEITPIYSGIAQYCQPVKRMKESNDDCHAASGGGYIDSWAMNGKLQSYDTQKKTFTIELSKNQEEWFGLRDVISSTSSALSEEFERRNKTLAGLFPNYHYFSPKEAESNDNFSCSERLCHFGDGGLMENTGIMPLLKRRVKRIIVCLNTRGKLSVSDSLLSTDVSEDLPLLFGERHYDAFLTQKETYSMKPLPLKYFNLYPKRLKSFRGRVCFQRNHVFKDGPLDEKYEKLVKGLYSQHKEGKTALFRDKYEVLDNEYFGIKGGWTVDVTWLYNARTKLFESELSDKLRSELSIGNKGRFQSFPNVATIGENKSSFVGLKKSQASLLCELSCWNILVNKDFFVSLFNDAINETNEDVRNSTSCVHKGDQ